MNKLIAVVIGAALLLLLLLFSTTYTVSYHQVAIKTRFGQTGEGDESVVREPGLKFKLPFFADRVELLDTRVQLIESPLKTAPTADDQQVVIKAFLLWRVDEEGDGPVQFMRSYADRADAEEKLRDQLESALSAASRYTFNDFIGENNKVAEIEDAVQQELTRNLSTGVAPVMVGFSQIMLPQKTSVAVLRRMSAERESLARSERSKGQAEAARIRGLANTKMEKIRAFAGQRAEDIRAKGNTKAEEYLKEMNAAPELAIFLTWLDALEKMLSQYTTIVLDTSSAPTHLLDLKSPQSPSGIPMPVGAAAPLAPLQQGAAPGPDAADRFADAALAQQAVDVALRAAQLSETTVALADRLNRDAGDETIDPVVRAAVARWLDAVRITLESSLDLIAGDVDATALEAFAAWIDDQETQARAFANTLGVTDIVAADRAGLND